MTSARRGLILFAHGARDPQWAEPFEKIRGRIAAAEPDAEISLAYLELMQPGLGEAVEQLAARGVARISVVPLFMAQGGHMKKDLPALMNAIAVKYPHIKFRVTPAIGEVEAILAAIADWATAEYRKP